MFHVLQCLVSYFLFSIFHFYLHIHFLFFSFVIRFKIFFSYNIFRLFNTNKYIKIILLNFFSIKHFIKKITFSLLYLFHQKLPYYFYNNYQLKFQVQLLIFSKQLLQLNQLNKVHFLI